MRRAGLEFLEEDAADADQRGGLCPFTVFLFTVVLKADGASIGEIWNEHVIDEFFAVEEDGHVFL